ncbi:MAG TPA: biotin-dependent carboxyltransferase family protein, partial [Gammaproteobacteria bacterium]
MITVLDAGALTTVQDGGRFGYAHLGVPRAGAADLLSLRCANRLAGNADDRCAALEFTLAGPVLRFEVASVLALTGGLVDAQLDDQPIPMYQSVLVNAGQILACGKLRSGLRTYLAVHGGIRVAPVLGSMSADTLSGLGAPILRPQDVLDIEPAVMQGGFYLRAPPRFGSDVTLRILSGPHHDLFAPRTSRELCERRLTVSQRGDRTGVRLNEALSMPEPLPELPSQGMVTGAIQIPGDGCPLILLSNHGTTGGYPVIATVISADHSRMGQLAAGTRIQFEEVDRAQALKLLRDQEQSLQDDVVSADESLLEARALLLLANANPGLRELR